LNRVQQRVRILIGVSGDMLFRFGHSLIDCLLIFALKPMLRFCQQNLIVFHILRISHKIFHNGCGLIFRDDKFCREFIVGSFRMITVSISRFVFDGQDLKPTMFNSSPNRMEDYKRAQADIGCSRFVKIKSNHVVLLLYWKIV
jgi:hypothetical protein